MFFISTNLSSIVHWIMKKKFHYTEIWFQIVNFQFEVNNHRFLICYFYPCALKIEFMKKIMISSVLHLRRKFKALFSELFQQRRFTHTVSMQILVVLNSIMWIYVFTQMKLFGKIVLKQFSWIFTLYTLHRINEIVTSS